VPDKVDDGEAVASPRRGVFLATLFAFFLLLGEVAATKLPMRLVHGIAAVLFLVLGVLVLAGVGG